MNNIINFYYGINLIDIFKNEENYYFNYNGNNYSFIIYDRDKKDLIGLVDICNELKKRSVITNEFIINKFNNYLTPFNKNMYVLIKENVNNSFISVNDILYMQNNSLDIPFDKKIIRNDWINLWKNKIDFYENNFKNYKKYKLINKTIDYYIGLGENAIAYLNNNKTIIKNIVLSHRRISKKSSDFYNPLKYVVDSRARDIADYIKILFFYDNIDVDTICSILYYFGLNREELILFIARMLYPTYYFDLIDEIIYNNEDESILNIVINKNSEYIIMIKKILYYINYNLRMNVPVIDWIIKT